jgi:hypothetical protein
MYINALLSGHANPPIGKPAAGKNERNMFARNRIKDG